MRGHNEGNAHRRKSDGRWQLSVTMQPSGRRRTTYLPASKSKKEAQEALAEMLKLRDERSADLSRTHPLVATSDGGSMTRHRHSGHRPSATTG